MLFEARVWVLVELQQCLWIGSEVAGVETGHRGWLVRLNVLYRPFVSWSAAPEMALWEGVEERVGGGGVGVMPTDWGYICERVWMGQTGYRRGELELTESREVVGMSIGWKGFQSRESVKVWPWYETASRTNWKGRMEECGWGVNGWNTDMVVYEPWMDL